MHIGEQLKRLVSLVRQRNAVDGEIAKIIGRPVTAGHLPEAIAAVVFDIALHQSAVHKGSDGVFASGLHIGKSVDIKRYSDKDLLGMPDESKSDFYEKLPEFYLVFAGPRKAATSSRGTTAPWNIHSVHLFDAAHLVRKLRERSPRPHIAGSTSVAIGYWNEAEIYPRTNPAFPLTEDQRDALALFSEAAVG